MKRCEKYTGWISDEALRRLAPGREGELLAHATECDDCRAAYEHARELAKLVDEGIESLVAGAPSAHFEARLRARIAEEHAPARFVWLGWKSMSVALAVALVAAVVFVSYAPRSNNRRPAPPDTQTAALKNPGSTPAAGFNSASNAGGSTTHSREKPGGLAATSRGVSHDKRGSGLSWAVQATNLRPASRQHHSERTVPSSAEPEVIVPPGQLAAAMQLADAIQSGQVDGRQLAAAEQEADKRLEIAPIEIKVIEIAPLEPSQTAAQQDGPAESKRP
jgi:hypothetical protein